VLDLYAQNLGCKSFKDTDHFINPRKDRNKTSCVILPIILNRAINRIFSISRLKGKLSESVSLSELHTSQEFNTCKFFTNMQQQVHHYAAAIMTADTTLYLLEILISGHQKLPPSHKIMAYFITEKRARVVDVWCDEHILWGRLHGP